MRSLHSHQPYNTKDLIQINVLDEPGAGGACHEYKIYVKEAITHKETDIKFQKGPIEEKGTNGITIEALLAIVEDRLISFQAGPFSCRENALALTKIQEAMSWLHKRTTDRIRAKVEGYDKKIPQDISK